MITKRKSKANGFLEEITDGPLTLGEALMSIRLGEGLSQVAFAAQLGISRSFLCDTEKGRKSVSPARAAKWAKILGYSDKQFVRLALQDMVEQAGLKMTVRVNAT